MVRTRSWRFTAAMSGGLWNRAPVKHSRACREKHNTQKLSLRPPVAVYAHTAHVYVIRNVSSSSVKPGPPNLHEAPDQRLQQNTAAESRRPERERGPGDTQRMDKTRSSSHTQQRTATLIDQLDCLFKAYLPSPAGVRSLAHCAAVLCPHTLCLKATAQE